MDNLDSLLASQAGGEFLESASLADTSLFASGAAWGGAASSSDDPLRELLGESLALGVGVDDTLLGGSSAPATAAVGAASGVQETWEIHDLMQEYSTKVAAVKGQKLEMLAQEHQVLAEDFKYNLQLIDERDALIDERDATIVQLRGDVALLSEKVASRDATRANDRERAAERLAAKEAALRSASVAADGAQREVAALRADRVDLLESTAATRTQLEEEHGRLVAENVCVLFVSCYNMTEYFTNIMLTIYNDIYFEPSRIVIFVPSYD